MSREAPGWPKAELVVEKDFLLYDGVEVRAVDGSDHRHIVVPKRAYRLFGDDGGDDLDSATKCVLFVTRPLFDAIPRIHFGALPLPTCEDMVWDENDDMRRWGYEDGEETSVYFGLSQDTGLVKVGYTRDPERRFAAYRTHSAGHIEFMPMPGNRLLERSFKRFFKRVRFRSEWFYPHPALLKYIIDAWG